MPTLTEPTSPLLLTARETAGIFRCDIETVYRWRREGVIKSVDIAGLVRFRADDVARIVMDGCGHRRLRTKSTNTVSAEETT